MHFVRLLYGALLVGICFGCADTCADTPVREAILYCDSPGNRALLLFDGGWNDLPRLPEGIAGGLDQLAPANNRTCTLGDGREIKAKIGHEQAFPYGMCGADPAYFFSLWIDRKKVISAGDFYTGCEYGFSRRAIVLDGARLTDCRLVPAEGQEGVLRGSKQTLTCSEVSSLLAAATHDPVEYPADGSTRPVHSIVVQLGEVAYCERFIQRMADKEERWDGLTTRWGPGDLFRVDAGARRLGDKAKIEKVRRGTIYRVDLNNDGQEDRVLWSHEESHYLATTL